MNKFSAFFPSLPSLDFLPGHRFAYAELYDENGDIVRRALTFNLRRWVEKHALGRPLYFTFWRFSK